MSVVFSPRNKSHNEEKDLCAWTDMMMENESGRFERYEVIDRTMTWMWRMEKKGTA
jgi:hypothetical protein